MGNCAKSNSHRHKAIQLPPPDIQQYQSQSQSLNSLQFQGSIGNIKIQNASSKTISIRFQIHQVIDLPLPKKIKVQNETQIKWKVHQKFTFNANQLTMRTKVLKVFIYDQNYKEINHLKINLYYIINGPYHHDLALQQTKKPMRLIFDCKIAEVIKVIVNPSKVQIELNKQYPGQQFNYSFKILKHDDTHNALASSPSQPQTVPLNKTNSYRRMSEQQQCPSPTKRRKTACKLIKVQTTSIVNWEKQKNKDMSNFDVYMNVSSLMKASIQFIMWKNQINQNDQQICIFFADCYFPFSQLFQEESTQMKKNKEISKQICFQEHLYTNGKVVGQVQFTIDVKYQGFYRQSHACARTQDGVVNMTPSCGIYGSFKSKNQQIQKIYQLTILIENRNVELNNSIGNYNVSKKIRNQMNKLFQEIVNNLQNLNEYVVANTKQQKLQLIKDQQNLFNIVEKLYPFIQDEDVCFSEFCWKIIVSIMRRPQFYLKNMSFTELQSQKNEQNKKNFQQKKLQNALQYQKIMNQILLLALNFAYSDYRKASKAVAQQFKALCYIRIPVFRQQFLQRIVKSSDQQVAEWKFQDLSKEQLFAMRLDWDGHFYQPLKNNSIMQKLMHEMKQNLQGNVWLKQISNRKNEFFYFTKYLITKLQQFGKQLKFYKWHYVPGYNKIVRSFLIQMKSMNIIQYPRSLEIASTCMLSNQRLINIQMTILMQKTNCYEVTAVMKSLDLLSKYFAFLVQNKGTLPVTFNYLFFFKAIKIIIQSSFSYSTSKALVLLYTFFHNFSVEFRQNILKYLLGKAFFKLFLHWSYSVRSVFYHILLLKLDDEINSNNQFQWAMHQVSAKYKHNIKLILKAEQARKKQKRQNMVKTYQKDLFKIMKRKINQKKIDKKEKEKEDQSYSPTRKRRGTVCFATPQVNKKDKYRLSQLATRQDPSSDFQLDMEMLSKLQSRFSQKKDRNIGTPSNGLLHMRKAESNFTCESQSNDSFADLDKTQKKNKVRRFSFYAEQDFQLSEIQTNQLPYLSVAANQFKQITSAIKKYINQKGELPKIDLGLQLAIDQKDIRPSVADNIE